VYGVEVGGDGPAPARSRARSWAWWLFALNGLILVTIPLWAPVGRSELNVGTPPWSGRRSSATVKADEPVPVGHAEVASVEVHSARLADLEPVITGRRPYRLRIPSLRVAAPIVPVGIDPTGTMEVPEDIRTVGWYRLGPSPGEVGSSVLVGHVDSRLGGPGVFFRLSSLEPSDEVHVRLAGGAWRAFEVVSRTLVPKGSLPTGAFTREGDPILTLITCGGGFDWAAGSYTHNLLVAAVPRD
jgi:sortase (surface protein transpeptidase)